MKTHLVTDINATYDLYGKRIYDHSFHGGLEVQVRMLKAYSQLSKGDFLNRLLPEPLYTQMLTMLLPPFHRFYEVFDEKIQQMVTAGIVNFLSEAWVQPERVAKYKHLHLQEPQVLTMAHLEAGFVIWLISVSFAIFAFLLEWIAKLYEFFIIRMVLRICFDLKIGQK